MLRINLSRHYFELFLQKIIINRSTFSKPLTSPPPILNVYDCEINSSNKSFYFLQKIVFSIFFFKKHLIKHHLVSLVSFLNFLFDYELFLKHKNKIEVGK